MWKPYRLLLAVPALAALLTAVGCEDDIPDEDIAQFNRPADLALVCFDEEDGPLPLARCTNSERTDAQVYAFVTQTEYGEVAIVDLEDYKVVDQEDRIPFNSFIPVGGQPSDIAAAHNGTRVYTVNFETRDMSVIDVEERLARPSLTPAASVDLGAPAARIVIASDAGISGTDSISDRFAFVTQPTVGRVAVVNLQPYTVVDDDGVEREIPAGPLAWLRLDAGTLSPTPIVDERPEGIAPFAMQASSRYASLYVSGQQGGFGGSPDGNYVLEIHTGAFVARARESFEQTGAVLELPAVDVAVRRMDIGTFTARDMSIEPELERWIYIVENESGGIVVLDLVSEQLLEVNSWNDAADDPYSIAVPGIARKVKLLRLGETLDDGELPDPFTFNGTFGLVSTTQSAVFVLDVAIDDGFAASIGDYTVYPHSLRSVNLWYEEGDDDGEEEQAPLFPELGDAPVLVADGTTYSLDETPFVAAIPTGVNPETACADDPGGFRYDVDEDAYNLFFRCDRRMSTAETWQLAFQGALGISGVGVLLDGDDNTVVFRDEYKDFCSAGALGPAGADLWGAWAEGENSLYFEGFRNYPGDFVKITSAPAPMRDGVDCTAYEDEEIVMMYRISGIVDSSTLQITPLESTEERAFAPLPTRECFGQAFTYEIRASDSWVLTGTSTGRLSRGSMRDGMCVPWLEESDNGDHPRLSSRVFEGVPFENSYLRFLLNPVAQVEEGAMKTTTDQLAIVFSTINGFSPMSVVLGADITDIEVSPGGDVLLIDQSEQGLLMFDMADEFSLISEPIN